MRLYTIPHMSSPNRVKGYLPAEPDPLEVLISPIGRSLALRWYLWPLPLASSSRPRLVLHRIGLEHHRLPRIVVRVVVHVQDQVPAQRFRRP